MNLRDLKFEPLDKSSQVIIFDESGLIIESDDSLVKVKGKSFNIFSDSMFCGMNEMFSQMKEEEEMSFDCIEIDLFGRTSHYDFIVKRLDNRSASNFVWIIYDFGMQYEKIFELQQERNIAEIRAKKADRESRKLREEKDAIEKLYNELQGDSASQYILVKADNLLVNLDLSDVYYFEAYGDYIKVHTTDKMYVTYNTMKKLESSLPSKHFFRIHRSYIVRLDKVKNIEQYSLVVKDKVLHIGKNYKSSLLDKIGQL
ncbi:LytR/AlgR family response regulator transcription factor [Ekhidna sp.]